MILTVTLVLSACASVSINRSGDSDIASFAVKDAGQLSLFSSVNGYAEIKGVRDGGRWRFMMPHAKSYRYFLKKDGEIYLPECPMKESDGFGGKLCVYEEE
ncbi:MAG: hypothetical protein AB7E96_01360 [Deferribacterales bacterium]